MASPQNVQKPNQQAANRAEADQPGDLIASISLRIEDGLLMAFGPDGDAMPPSLVKQACADDPDTLLRLHDGTNVPSARVLAVLDAQQQGPLADQRHRPWIEAMLGLGGRFEPTPETLLDNEPNTPLPPLAA